MELGLTAPYSWNKYEVKTVQLGYAWNKHYAYQIKEWPSSTYSIYAERVYSEYPIPIRIYRTTNSMSKPGNTTVTADPSNYAMHYYWNLSMDYQNITYTDYDLIENSNDYLITPSELYSKISQFIIFPHYIFNTGTSGFKPRDQSPECYKITNIQSIMMYDKQGRPSTTSVYFDAAEINFTGIKYTVQSGKGDYIGEVTSGSQSEFPTNGPIREGDEVWYEYTGPKTEKQQGNFIGVVHSDQSNAYPTNGIHTDGYWYVKL